MDYGLFSKQLSSIIAKPAGQNLGALRKVTRKLDSKGTAIVYKSTQICSTLE